MKFKKINEFKYIIEEGLEIAIQEADKVLINISSSDNFTKDNYSSFVNDKLFLEILSRIISKNFLSNHVLSNDVLMASIEYTWNNKTYYTSVGYMEDLMVENFEKRYVDGILIK